MVLIEPSFIASWLVDQCLLRSLLATFTSSFAISSFHFKIYWFHFRHFVLPITGFDYYYASYLIFTLDYYYEIGYFLCVVEQILLLELEFERLKEPLMKPSMALEQLYC
jgi:hypothetical protein